LAIVAAIVAVLVGTVHTIASAGRPLVFGGDQAVLAIRVHDATQLHATLGPYSRFGWSHLGPALFYLFAPAYSLSSGNPWSLLVDCLLVNGAALVATVAVVRNFAGEWSARWALMFAGTVLLTLGAVSVETLWNPNLEGPAVLLLLVLAAGAFSGSRLAIVGAALVGTYLVQTDIGTVPIVAVAGGCAVIGCTAQWAMRRKAARSCLPGDAHSPGANLKSVRIAGTRTGDTSLGGRRLATWLLAAAGMAVVIIAWIPPTLQQLDGRPGNISKLARFFTSTQTGPGTSGSNHTLSQSWHVVANAVSMVPFGAASATAPFINTSTAREAVLVVTLTAATVAIIWAWQQRNAFALGLALMSLIGLVIALVAAMRIVGQVYSYLMLWAVFIPVPAWTGIALLAVTGTKAEGQHRRSAPRWMPVLAGVATCALLAPIVIFAWQVSHVPWDASSTDPQIPTITTFVTRHLRLSSTKRVVVVIANGDRWPVAAGVILALIDDGYEPEIQPAWAFMFTARYVAGPAPAAELVLSDIQGPPGTALANAPSVTVAGSYGPTIAQFIRPPP
jgi:hypothetical protein